MKQKNKFFAVICIPLFLIGCGTEPIDDETFFEGSTTTQTTTLPPQKPVTEYIITYKPIVTEAVTETTSDNTLFVPENNNTYSVRIGKTNTAAEFCKAPHSEVIMDVMPNTELNILAVSSLQYTPEDDSVWYLTEYDGEFGYIRTNQVDFTDKTFEPETKHLIALGQMLYVDALYITKSNYIPCFHYNPENKVFTSVTDSEYVILDGITSQDDIFNALHKFFSAKYDSRRLIQIIIDAEMIVPIYDYWGASPSLFTQNLSKVDALYSTRHRTVNLKVNEKTDDEVFFSGNIIWNQTSPDYGLQDNHTEIENFSIVFEDGIWKIGLF